MAAERGITPFMVVHAALAVLLARLSDTDDIAVGSPSRAAVTKPSTRSSACSSTRWCCTTRIVSGETFDALLERVRTTDLEAFANSDVPFETVVDALDPVRSEAFAPLAQIALSFNPGASVDGADVTVDDLRVAPIAAPLVPAHQDMTVVVTSGPAGEPWSAMATYATDLFDEPTVSSMLGRLIRLLDAVTDDPGRAVGDVDLLGDGEREQVLADSAGPLRTPRRAPSPRRSHRR